MGTASMATEWRSCDYRLPDQWSRVRCGLVIGLSLMFSHGIRDRGMWRKTFTTISCVYVILLEL